MVDEGWRIVVRGSWVRVGSRVTGRGATLEVIMPMLRIHTCE